MPRPKRLIEFGFVLESTSTALGPPPKTDANPEVLARLAEVCGMFIESVPRVIPARFAFPDGPEGDVAFTAHLDRLAEIHAAAMQNKTPQERRKTKYRYRNKLAYLSFRREGKSITGADLRLVNCARCRRELLAPSDECVRRETRNTRAVKSLPPPVAELVTDRGQKRPVCKDCLASREK